MEEVKSSNGTAVREQEPATKDRRLKLFNLLGLCGVAAMSGAKEVISGISDADIARCLANMQAFLSSCKPLDNGHAEQVCPGDSPQFPSMNTNLVQNILTGASVLIQLALILMAIKSFRASSSKEGQPNDEVSSSSGVVPDEASNLV